MVAKIHGVCCFLIFLLSFNSTAFAENIAQLMTLQGIIHEERANIKSVNAWNASGDPYYVLELTSKDNQIERQTLTLRPSANVSFEDLKKFNGQSVTLKGYYTEGKRTNIPLTDTFEQTPIEPRLETNISGDIVNIGWQTMKRGWGFVALAIVKDSTKAISMSGEVLDYEWAHASNRLALLIVDQQQQNIIIIVDAEHNAEAAQIPIPAAFRPSCFAWLSDDSGFLLAMAKPNKEDEFAEDLFYRYTFTGKQFEPAHPDIERQFSHIFCIKIDQGTNLWAAASVGEGHPDLMIYQEAMTVLSTDVFPWSITPIIWEDHRLWCVSEAYLEFGFTNYERARNPLFDPKRYPERGWGNGAAYRVNPVTKQATQDQIEMTALEAVMYTSYNRRYLSELTHNADSFTLTIISQP